MSDYSFTEKAAREIAEAVRRDKRHANNSALPWRARRIAAGGGSDIAWALTPPTGQVMRTPISQCMISKTPSGEYGDPNFAYGEIIGEWSYCAGLWPSHWVPIHSKSKGVLCGGAWLIFGTAATGCSQDGYFDLTIGSDPLNTITCSGIHSPLGSISAGDSVYCGYKAGMGEYGAMIGGC